MLLASWILLYAHYLVLSCQRPWIGKLLARLVCAVDLGVTIQSSLEIWIGLFLLPTTPCFTYPTDISPETQKKVYGNTYLL